MSKPIHPGRILKENYVLPSKLTINVIADHLGTTRKTLDAIINERSGITARMALRLSKAFNTSPLFWLQLQNEYDLEIAKQTDVKYRQINPLLDEYQSG